MPQKKTRPRKTKIRFSQKVLRIEGDKQDLKGMHVLACPFERKRQNIEKICSSILLDCQKSQSKKQIERDKEKPLRKPKNIVIVSWQSQVH